MSLIKIFSGSEILGYALKAKIEAVGITTIIKNNIESGRISGFGTADQSMDIFIKKIDFLKANVIVEEFKSHL